jgi:DNA-binding XRE family transcriptional regulator
MFTGPICKAARSIVQVSRAKLAANTGVARETIETFERGIEVPDENTVSILKEALENLGAVFIPEDGANGAGVRLKFSRSVTSRLDNLVNEGGPSAKDAVP